MSIDTFLLSSDTTDLNYPEIRPTLDLNFARVKALDPRITFTRASGGSYVGADGLIKLAGVNEARFDHDPYTGESLGLLIEEARTNLLLRSEEFNNAGWSKNAAPITANATVAPDGTLSADKLIPNNTFTRHYVQNQVTITANVTHTVSCFAKSAELNFASVIFGMGGSPFTRGGITINLTTGAVSNYLIGPPLSFVPHPVQYYGNGWWKISVSVLIDTTTTFGYVEVGASSLSTNYSGYSGDNSSGIFVWGAQLEVGAFPTSYIPTIGSTRTRAADNARIIGKNFSEWYRPDEGTFVVGVPKASGLAVWSTARVLNVFGPRFQLGAGGDFAMVNDVSAVPFQMGVSPSYPKRIASAYKLGNYAQSNEGRLVSSTANTICTGQTVLQIGTLVNNFLSGTISRLTYFPKRLPNAQLQALTR